MLYNKCGKELAGGEGGDGLRRSFMEWFLALLRRDMEAYPVDKKSKDALFKKIQKKK